MELRVNDRDIGGMSSQLTGLESRYRLLMDEKTTVENEHKTKSDKNLRTIAQLRTELDCSKRLYEERSSEYDTLLNDLGEMESLASMKEQVLESLRSEECEASEMRQRAEEELTAYKRRLDKLITDRNHFFSKKERDNTKLEEMMNSCRNIEEQIGSAEEEVRMEVSIYEGKSEDIEQSDRAVENINEATKERSSEFDDLQRTLNDLEAEIKTRRREKDELKARLSNLQISFRREQNSGMDSEQTNHSYDVTIRQKNVQCGQKQNELETHNEDIEKESAINSHLTNNVESLKKNIEGLIGINKDILEEMRNFTETDEQIRYMLDRRNRVNDLRSRTERDIQATTSFRSSSYAGY